MRAAWLARAQARAWAPRRRARIGGILEWYGFLALALCIGLLVVSLLLFP